LLSWYIVIWYVRGVVSSAWIVVGSKLNNTLSFLDLSRVHAAWVSVALAEDAKLAPEVNLKLCPTSNPELT
jgi:hypothetical protein